MAGYIELVKDMGIDQKDYKKICKLLKPNSEIGSRRISINAITQ